MKTGRVNQLIYSPPGGWIPMAGVLLLAAWVPLWRYPALTGARIVPFLCSFMAASIAYLWALRRLDSEAPSLRLVWGFAVAFRLALLLTPVTLSEDVYRYIWDGHLLSQGANPYAQPVQAAVLDGFDTPLRARVNFPWMATPYLPAAQGYFAIVETLAPQNPWAFQVGAAILDLAAGAILLLALRRLRIPERAILVYLWNPLVMVEFAHGAHVDALMEFFVALALWGFVTHRKGGRTLSALALAAGVLVKGWPILIAPLFIRRWGVKRTILFGVSVFLPLVVFAASAGWGLGGPADGRGVFGALRIYAASWSFNSGLYQLITKLVGPQAARLTAVLAPGLTGLGLGWLDWRAAALRANSEDIPADLDACRRRWFRWAALPFGLYLVLAPTVHPWYLTQVLALLPFFWPAEGEPVRIRRWIWPWLYFMLFEAFTYLAYSGVTLSQGLEQIQIAAYIPFWALLVWAGLPEVRYLLDLSRVWIRI